MGLTVESESALNSGDDGREGKLEELLATTVVDVGGGARLVGRHERRRRTEDGNSLAIRGERA